MLWVVALASFYRDDAVWEDASHLFSLQNFMSLFTLPRCEHFVIKWKTNYFLITLNDTETVSHIIIIFPVCAFFKDTRLLAWITFIIIIILTSI